MDRPGWRRFVLECDGERLSCVEAVPAAPDAARSTAVVLHGAGTGDKERLTGLMADLAARGRRALALDFSGHGGSSGLLRDLSLQRRFEQARALVDLHAPAGAGLLLVGFSMSGQTVADLAAHYGPRVDAVGLCAPAVYARRAWPLRFHDGFTVFSQDAPAFRPGRNGSLAWSREAAEPWAHLFRPGLSSVVGGGG
ncbi:alpha/beta hydrolase [Streptomyces sp. NPDC059506]|uniref:alpha/beta hydrolase n=1 Tax=Streptomyces sp. NPDC059506 TaxID=3347751 RepID=UPI0036957EBD